MRIHHIVLKNFRCFQDSSFAIEKPLVLVTGQNGSGKSSLLEAIHYACYLRSFRTHLPRELIQFDATNFFIRMNINQDLVPYTLHVGCSGTKRLVKIDEKVITSYKDLAQQYRIITITEDDLYIIKGGPEQRRLFVDQAVSLAFPEYIIELKKYRHIVDNRNALITRGYDHGDMFAVWTQHVWEYSKRIQEQRTLFLDQLQGQTNELLHTWFDDTITIRLTYQPKKNLYDTFDHFMQEHTSLFMQEQRFKRSLFGVHLDDIAIEFCCKTSRSFASRGQQKLILMLLKIAQMQLILAHKGSAIFLLDDFMTDFDPIRSKILLGILQTMNNQLFFTSPSTHGAFEEFLLSRDTQHIKLTM